MQGRGCRQPAPATGQGARHTMLISGAGWDVELTMCSATSNMVVGCYCQQSDRAELLLCMREPCREDWCGVGVLAKGFSEAWARVAVEV
jgi:hypothetical protein